MLQLSLHMTDISFSSRQLLLHDNANVENTRFYDKPKQSLGSSLSYGGSGSIIPVDTAPVG